MDPETPKLLHALSRQIAAGDARAQLSIIESLGLAQLIEPRTIVLALCIGGPELVVFIAALAVEHVAAPEIYRKIQLACETSGSNRDALLAEIIALFGLPGTADSILLSIKHEMMLNSGRPADIVNAAAAEMKAENWTAAANGFTRAIELLKEQTPRPVFAHAATCLHRLGRFTEAEELSLRGLGPQRELIAIKGSVPTEEEFFRRWKDRREPLVSITCMTYNHGRYIDGAIRGFLAQQTSFPFEILIHDDASTDRTPDLVRAWQEKYPAIIRPILQTENQLSRGRRAFEIMLAQTRGKYVAVCEGDDYWIEPSKLQKQVGLLERHPDLSCSGHNYYLYNESSLTVNLWEPANRDYVVPEHNVMCLAPMVWLPTLVFRKTFSAMPPEREFAALGDQFLSSYLGTFGKCAYLEKFFGSVRRENQYSIWTPISAGKKEAARVKTWFALIRLHENLGNDRVVAELQRRIDASSLSADRKSALSLESMALRSSPVLAAS